MSEAMILHGTPSGMLVLFLLVNCVYLGGYVLVAFSPSTASPLSCSRLSVGLMFASLG
jgi:hypothetical protein